MDQIEGLHNRNIFLVAIDVHTEVADDELQLNKEYIFKISNLCYSFEIRMLCLHPHTPTIH